MYIPRLINRDKRIRIPRHPNKSMLRTPIGTLADFRLELYFIEELK